MKTDQNTLGGASALAAAGALWPTAYCSLTYWMASPIERAMQTGGYCGAAPQAFEILGHCPACWSGAAAFFIAAAAVLGGASVPNQKFA